ncbi:hypothetical protein B0T24DRAFT_430692 [Lasiosphaeria ovina]|uniref:Uncharacterized protein n=1 Tax=Lasiosphaeria ovina TaxID=92902 RepID=A0AAE0MZM3_9PEZI|nr:hypothetical protein B0T24DRAFT_430692 [Lasiosphaeria ovina]
MVAPIVKATIQSAAINAVSNVVAQFIAAQRSEQPLIINWISVFQFFIFGCVCTPPNFMWQDLLESSFPGYHMAPTSEAVASAAAGDDKELDREAREGRLVEPRLNKGNTLAKTLLDQTVGAAFNTLLFSTFMHAIRDAMAHHHAAPVANGLGFLLGGQAIRYENVDWLAVWHKTRAEFFSILVAGWTFWPLISIVNFVFLKTVEARNLMGSLAGLAWGVYVSLFLGK